MKRILVTGGLGYIGSHTVVELQNKGFEVVVIDNLSNSTLEVKKRIEKITDKKFDLLVEDVNDEAVLDQLFAKNSFDGVIHFAAYKAVGESVDFPIKYYRNNISGLITLLSVMEKYETKNLIFSSSCTVYGTAKELPVTENSPIQIAESPYGTTKIICEEIIQDFVKYNPISAILLRYFNPVGAHPSSEIGELPLGIPNNLVPYITQTAAGIRDKITVFGNDYNTKDGTCVRDYIHVVDLANAHVKALEFAAEMTSNIDVFNIGTGTGNTVLEVIRAFEDANSINLNYKMGARRTGDVEQIWADTTKITSILGWKPKYNLSDMMKHAWKWQENISKQELK